MSYSTTVYEPAEGAHVYVRGIPDEANSECATCGEYPWRDCHAMVERHVHDIPAEDCLYRMDASDNNGKSWGSNGLRWRTQADAARWARDLSLRWFGCTDLRIVRAIRCPDWDDPSVASDEDRLTGCGSANIQWDGEVFDCLDCGLFFTPEAGTAPEGHDMVAEVIL